MTPPACVPLIAGRSKQPQLFCDAASRVRQDALPHSSLLRNLRLSPRLSADRMEEETMDGLIYLVGLIVIILAILSFFGLR